MTSTRPDALVTAQPEVPSAAAQHDVTSVASLDRRRHGLDVLSRIDGEAGTSVIDALAGISPALGHHVAAFAFGDIYDRPGLDPRSRQLVTIGVLTALGGCEPQLKVHVGAALNVGLTPDEIVEAMLHATVYAGFPRALNATFAAKEVFEARGIPMPPTGDHA
ncbi:carboxymuconolactone decarboxylase family protein [Actinoplanes missouriensis]|uniref:carboxymuconolactone decarboxylase family protein n=1 Tax=Actinoplanes missouriensis TaxID=1866 RepID=UPI0033E7449D